MTSSATASINANDVLEFWFTELGPEHWFDKNPTLDATIRERFGLLYGKAKQCELYPWRATAHGRLAEIIVLDQFPRNMFRDQAQAFETDALALALAQEAVACGADQALPVPRRAFLYLPYMHSESLEIHKTAMQLFNQPGLEGNYAFEIKHKAILEQFGRYPHRNAALGRLSTPQETEFLRQPGSAF